MPTSADGLYPYEILVRLYPALGISCRRITVVGGRSYEGDPEPLSGLDDPLVSELAERFAAAAIEDRDAARSAEAELARQFAQLQAEAEGLRERVAQLESQLEARRPVTAVSPAQARQALMQWGLLEAVDLLVAHASPAVQIKWEYATEIRRDDPDVIALFGMLDGVVMPDQLDELFELAATL